MSQPQSNKKKELGLAQHIGLSCVSSGMAEILTLPIDTIKVHIQSNPEQKLTVRNSWHQITKMQGVRGLGQAWIPSLSRQVSYTGIRLGLYSYIKDQWPHQSMVQSMVIGGSCGLIGNFVAMPFDVIKTRIQGQSSYSTARKPITQLIRTIHQEHGILGFYRGLSQTAQRSVAISSIQLPLYFSLQDKLTKSEKANGLFKDNLWLRTTTASVLTTCVVTGTVYPIDLCKSLVMNSPNKSTSTLKEGLNLIKNYGPSSIYRGMSMGLCRAIPHFLITTMCYEKLNELV